MPALDVLRGIAILGTLLTNIWIFSAPRSVGGGLPTDIIPDAAQNGFAGSS
ncbi:MULTISPECIES: hypothetical protein [Kocuria]|uniref:Uncharacterized protein n=1 Tax=Kocuria subflava TaxID=1736139 RepID=A0A846TYS9_9MICC|nr:MULTISPECIES: hypothetical protein [Kocuria]NKE10754.1 hypothetical protein [Kocuria subflava]